MSTDKKSGADQSNQENEIKIEDLPVESGRDGDTDDVRGGKVVLQDIALTPRPRRP